MLPYASIICLGICLLQFMTFFPELLCEFSLFLLQLSDVLDLLVNLVFYRPLLRLSVQGKVWKCR